MDQISIPTTLLYAGLLTLMYVVTIVLVIEYRRTSQIKLGTADDPALFRRVRAHGHLAEYVPLVLFLMLVLELTGTPAWVLHTGGLIVFLTRFIHLYSILSPTSHVVFRIIGIAAMMSVLAIAGVLALLKAFAA